MPFRVKGGNRAKLNKAIWDVIESCGYFSERKAPCGVGLIQLALAFSKPDIWKGKDILGWDGTGFQLQNCKIIKGRYEKTPPELFLHQFDGPSGSSYRWRSEVINSLLQATSLEATWAWATVFGCINQILSPVAQRPVPKLVFEYDEYHNTDFTRILRLLGVPIITEFWRHSWPAISVEKPTRHQKFKAITIPPQDGPVKGKGIYRVKAPLADELRPVNIPTAFRTVIPNFLAWFTLQDLTTCFDKQSSWEKQTLSLVQKWATEREIKNLFPVFQAAIQLTHPPSH